MINYKFRTRENNPFHRDEDIYSFLLYNRGIDDPEHYINTTDADIHDWNLLGNIDSGVKLIEKFIEAHQKKPKKTVGVVLVDCDCDGNVASSIIYNYLKENFDIELKVVHHTGKQHGLDDKEAFKEIQSYKPQLVIVPDAGTNDIKECNELITNGADVLVLDHHDVETSMSKMVSQALQSPSHVIINPRVCEYPNKDLSGGAVVYKFIQALDNCLFTNSADDYLDLVALSLIADSMSLKSFENRHLVKKGLSQLKHPLLLAIKDKQKFSLEDKNVLVADDVAFYIAPLINGMMRMGKQEDKKLMFQGFCKEFEMFEYKRYKSSDPVPEDIYTRVARVCYNTKNRQNKLRDSGTEKMINLVKACGDDKDSIIVINDNNELERELTGLTAMRVCDHFKKPVLIGHPKIEIDNDEEGKETIVELSGSMRSIDAITNFKDLLEETGMFDKVAGHQGAGGFTIPFENIPKMKQKMNKIISKLDIDLNAVLVDMMLEDEEIDPLLVKEISEFKEYVGNDIKAPKFMIRNAVVHSNKLYLNGAKQDTLKWENEDDVTYIQFKTDCQELIDFYNESRDKKGTITVDVYGTFDMNSYNGMMIPQVKVSKIDVKTETKKIEEYTQDELELLNYELDLDGDEWS